MTTRIVNTVDAVNVYRVTGKTHGRVALRLQVVAPAAPAALGIAEKWIAGRDAYRNWLIEWQRPQRARNFDPDQLLIGVYPQFEVDEPVRGDRELRQELEGINDPKLRAECLRAFES